jgi:hypothetical protein
MYHLGIGLDVNTCGRWGWASASTITLSNEPDVRGVSGQSGLYDADSAAIFTTGKAIFYRDDHGRGHHYLVFHVESALPGRHGLLLSTVMMAHVLLALFPGGLLRLCNPNSFSGDYCFLIDGGRQSLRRREKTLLQQERGGRWDGKILCAYWSLDCGFSQSRGDNRTGGPFEITGFYQFDQFRYRARANPNIACLAGPAIRDCSANQASLIFC